MRLDDLPLYAGQATRVIALVSRDRQLLRLPLDLRGAQDVKTWRLSMADASMVAQWVMGPTSA